MFVEPELCSKNGDLIPTIPIILNLLCNYYSRYYFHFPNKSHAHRSGTTLSTAEAESAFVPNSSSQAWCYVPHLCKQAERSAEYKTQKVPESSMMLIMEDT